MSEVFDFVSSDEEAESERNKPKKTKLVHQSDVERETPTIESDEETKEHDNRIVYIFSEDYLRICALLPIHKDRVLTSNKSI
jgi:hypothetical protein